MHNFVGESIFDILGLDDYKEERKFDEYYKYDCIWKGKASWNNGDVPSLKIAAGIAQKITGKTFVEFSANVASYQDNEILTDKNGKLLYNSSKRLNYHMSKSTKFINDKLNEFVRSIENIDEIVNALGKVLIKCLPVGNTIRTAVIRPKDYYAVNYNTLGQLTSVLVEYAIKKGDYKYLLYEYDSYDELTSLYKIEYFAFKSPKDTEMYARIAVNSVDDWKNLKEVQAFENISVPLFVEVSLYDGKPLYEPAIKNIEEADRLYGMLLTEYASGAPVIIAGQDTFDNDGNGPILPNAYKRQYLVVNGENAPTYEVISPALRSEKYLEGINFMLRLIESNCGLSHGTISTPETSTANTATEINETKQDTMTIVGNKQKLWDKSLRQLAEIFNQFGQIYNMIKMESYEIDIVWGDGIKLDDDIQFERLKWMVSSGIIDPVYLIAWERGVSQDEAYLMLPDSVVDLPEASDI